MSSFNLIEGDVTVRSSGGVEMSTADGVALVSNPRGFIGVLYDGTNTRFVRGDTSGRLTIVGAVAVGAAVAGNPVLVGGTDGTNARYFLLDTSGRAVVIGSLADNASNPTTKVGVLPAKATAAAPSWTEGNIAPLSVLLAGQLRTDLTSWLGATTPTVGQKAMAASIPVVIASDQTALINSATATSSNVSQNTSNVTLLSANSARKGATIYNDAPGFLYLKLGTTASSTSFTVKMNNGGYYEVPFGYTGRIDGIWTVAGSGAARIVELT